MSISKNQIETTSILVHGKALPSVHYGEDNTYQEPLFERLAGSHEHTDECKTITIYHVGGNNTHIHNLSVVS